MSGNYTLSDVVERFKALFVRVYAAASPADDPLKHVSGSFEVDMAGGDLEIRITKKPKIPIGTQAEVKSSG